MKIKLLLPLTLLFCLFLSASALAEKDVIYNGIITRRFANSTTNVYTQMDKDSEVIKQLYPGNKIAITAVHPGWVEIKSGSGVGYVLRHRIDVTENPYAGVTPDYPILPMPYYAVIDRVCGIFLIAVGIAMACGWMNRLIALLA